ncbi:unnamed protein product [Dovyalis caffra]|uniref:Hydroxyproline-rich glycoprotein family protein n=1 Tax=Dovyalis caffra TaxID=77055 RepID=A0AAV1R1G8_9ROSI|nr:unnamed protein product [Dovyalis caffra]
MAMPPGNVVRPDKMQFPTGAGGGSGGSAAGGNEIHQNHQPYPQRHQWFPVDERDGFISWLRGNLLLPMRLLIPSATTCVPLGNLQYFSVGEVVVALQQVVLRRQQQQNHHHQQRFYYDQGKVGGKDFKRSSSAGFNRGHRGGGGGEAVKEGVNSNVENHSFNGNSSEDAKSEKFEEVKSGGDVGKSDDKKADATVKPNTDNHLNSLGNSQGTFSGNSEAAAVNDQSSLKDLVVLPESDSHPSSNQSEKQNLAITPKTFVAEEMIDGQTVNVVDGLKLYEKLLDGLEVSKLVSLVNELRAAGRRGQFQGKDLPALFCIGLRLRLAKLSVMFEMHLQKMKMQMGPPKACHILHRRVEPIPALLQDIIGRLVGMQVMTMKPDSCIIDIYNEGDHSQPHMWPPWFGKPVSVLFLTECEMTLGRVIETMHHGDYRGSLKLSLAPGIQDVKQLAVVKQLYDEMRFSNAFPSLEWKFFMNTFMRMNCKFGLIFLEVMFLAAKNRSLLLMQGKSSDVAKHAIPMIRKQRMLVTFTKSQPKKFTSTDGSPLASHTVAPSSHWGPPPSRSPNHLRHPVPKHYAVIPTTGVLPVPSIRPQIPPPNGVQPLFMTAPVAAPMPFPAPVPIPPVSTGWPTASPRHPSARLPVPIPGTGVFLPPPGSGNASSPLQLSMAAAEMNFPTETASPPEKENGPGKSSHDTSASSKEKSAETTQRQDCNGVVDGRAVTKEEQ